MIKIRDMNADDVSAVMKIERVSFNEPWAEIHFYFDLYSKVSYNWVAECKDELCAYVCFWKIEDEVHINNIAVKILKFNFHPFHKKNSFLIHIL